MQYYLLNIGTRTKSTHLKEATLILTLILFLGCKVSLKYNADAQSALIKGGYFEWLHPLEKYIYFIFWISINDQIRGHKEYTYK